MRVRDYRSNYTSIKVIESKKAILEHGLGKEDFGKCPTQIADLEAQAEEVEDANDITRISNAFALPLPDTSKSLIGSEVINSCSFITGRGYPSIPYQLLKYALVKCPQLQYLLVLCISMNQRIHLPSSGETSFSSCAHNNDPSITSQEHLKYVEFDGFMPDQVYLDLISNNLPNIEIIMCKGEIPDAIWSYDLTAFKKLKDFSMDIGVAFNVGGGKKAFDSFFLHFKYVDGHDAFYSVCQNHVGSYQSIAVNQDFVLDNINSESRYLIFNCSDKIENFVVWGLRQLVGRLKYGNIEDK